MNSSLDPAGPYHARFQAVLAYVDDNLDGDLGVETLRRVAGFSRHHFQRQFTALFGVSVGRYVQLVRLKRASYRLAFRERDSVLTIALDSAYESPEAFSRAFRRQFDQSPSAFRSRPDWQSLADTRSAVAAVRDKAAAAPPSLAAVRLETFPETAVARLAHDGPPETVGDSIRRLIAWRREAGCLPPASATFTIFEDDPFRLILCAAAARVAPNRHGVEPGVIAGGRCAVLRVVGSSDDLAPAALALYRDWLPASGETPADRPLFARRLSLFPDTPEHLAETDLYLPLRPDLDGGPR